LERGRIFERGLRPLSLRTPLYDGGERYLIPPMPTLQGKEGLAPLLDPPLIFCMGGEKISYPAQAHPSG